MTRRRAVALVAALAVPALLWTPSFVARHYTSSAEPINFLSRPDKGWRFLYDAVTLSREAKLGSNGSALKKASDVWRHARAVRLVYLEGPIRVPVAKGGLVPPVDRRTVRPRSALTWLVQGRVRGHAEQVIGLLDYRSGRVLWDIRDQVPR